MFAGGNSPDPFDDLGPLSDMLKHTLAALKDNKTVPHGNPPNAKKNPPNKIPPGENINPYYGF